MFSFPRYNMKYWNTFFAVLLNYHQAHVLISPAKASQQRPQHTCLLSLSFKDTADRFTAPQCHLTPLVIMYLIPALIYLSLNNPRLQVASDS